MSQTQNTESTWLTRLTDEKEGVDEKVTKLKGFLLTDMFQKLEHRDQSDLREQLHHMEGYAWVLSRRIQRALAKQTK